MMDDPLLVAQWPSSNGANRIRVEGGNHYFYISKYHSSDKLFAPEIYHLFSATFHFLKLFYKFMRCLHNFLKTFLNDRFFLKFTRVLQNFFCFANRHAGSSLQLRTPSTFLESIVPAVYRCPGNSSSPCVVWNGCSISTRFFPCLCRNWNA